MIPEHQEEHEMPARSNRTRLPSACGMCIAVVALQWAVAQAQQADQPAADAAPAEETARQAFDVTIGPRELIRARDQMPFVMDASLPTLRRDDTRWFFFHVYFNEHGPGGRRLAVARARISDVLAAARNHTVTPWHKYRDGSWDEDGLTGFGSAVLPDCTARGGHPADLHADAAYNRAVGQYMITRWCYQEGVGRLYLHLSPDGVQFESQYLLDEEPAQWMPYSTFVAHEQDRETNDMSTVGGEFYVLIKHKSAANYGIDTLYRRKVTVSPK